MVLAGSVPGCGVAAWHTHGPGRTPGAHSPDVAGQSHLHISHSDRTAFPSVEAVSAGRALQFIQGLKAHQILLQFSSP